MDEGNMLTGKPHDLNGTIDGFPVFRFPTQSIEIVDCINNLYADFLKKR